MLRFMPAFAVLNKGTIFCFVSVPVLGLTLQGKASRLIWPFARNPVKNWMVGRTGSEANKPTCDSTWAGQTVAVSL